MRVDAIVVDTSRDGAGYYWTKYPVRDADKSNGISQFCSVLYAQSPADAERVAAARGISETIESGCYSSRRPKHEPRVSKTLRSRAATQAEKAHALTFLGWLSVKSLTRTVDEAFGDKGFVHEWMHGSQEPRQPKLLRAVLSEVERIEQEIPGYSEPR